MSQFDQLEDIPEDVIAEAFQQATTIKFAARNFNHIKYRKIAYGNIGWWLPLAQVLPLVGITPQMLRPVFNPQQRLVKRRFPFNYGWWGWNKNTTRLALVSLPAVISSYDELGNFPFKRAAFAKLAAVLQKTIEVYEEDGGSGECWHVFTVTPSGEITEAPAPVA